MIGGGGGGFEVAAGVEPSGIIRAIAIAKVAKRDLLIWRLLAAKSTTVNDSIDSSRRCQGLPKNFTEIMQIFFSLID